MNILNNARNLKGYFSSGIENVLRGKITLNPIKLTRASKSEQNSKKRGSASSSSGSSSSKKWRLVSMCMIPIIAGIGYNAFANHVDHERPEFIKYDYLRIRNKRFPWGDDGNKTLFHNAHVNPLPDGYED